MVTKKEKKIKGDEIKELKELIKNAYKDSNFFDSQFKIEKLKKKFDNELLIKLVRKEYNICKTNELQFNKEYVELQKKYNLRNKTHIWKGALSYITHRYKYGEWVLFKDYGKLRTGHIIKIVERGYKIFTGRKLGTQIIVKEKDVICHVADTNKMKEVFDCEK